MKRTAIVLLAVLCLASTAKAERYSVTDKGGFGITGRVVELPDRFGWLSYEIKYDFSVDFSARRLGEDSKLEITINKNDGGRWRYRCRASSDEHRMWANINPLYGRGVQVLTECRVDPRHFSRAVGLRPQEVGAPTIVFGVRILDGKAEAGIQKGFYFLSGSETEGSSMSQYVSQEPDPSDLGVIFNTNALPTSGRGPLSLYVP
jgi:hypothetical protein